MCYRYRTVVSPFNNSILTCSPNTGKRVAVKTAIYQALGICHTLELKDPIFFWEIRLSFLSVAFLYFFLSLFYTKSFSAMRFLKVNPVFVDTFS